MVAWPLAGTVAGTFEEIGQDLSPADLLVGEPLDGDSHAARRQDLEEHLGTRLPKTGFVQADG